jgi:hypothetical protein
VADGIGAKTTTTFAPEAAHPNSMLPNISSFMALPATRPVKVSPMPASNTTSTGTRESRHPSTTAAGRQSLIDVFFQYFSVSSYTFASPS